MPSIWGIGGGTKSPVCPAPLSSPEQREQREQFEQYEQFEQSEQREQFEQYEQFEQLEQREQLEQYEQYEQFEQSEQSEQFEQYEQYEQSEQSEQFFNVARDSRAFSSDPQNSTLALLPFSSVIQVVIVSSTHLKKFSSSRLPVIQAWAASIS